MPTIPEPQTTFAFSKKQNAWTTRYSFVPTCYGNSSEELLSFEDQNGNVWRHDVNETRNYFYGDYHYSEMEVSFNDLPSEVKSFKSLSIEGNESSDWVFSFSTNDDYDDRNGQSSKLFGSLLNDKEGFKYVEIPRSEKNSTANITYVPKFLDPDSALQALEDFQQEIIDSPNPSVFAGWNEISFPILRSDVSFPFSEDTNSNNGVELVGYIQTIAADEFLNGVSVGGYFSFLDFLNYVGFGANQAVYFAPGVISNSRNIFISNHNNSEITLKIYIPDALLIPVSSGNPDLINQLFFGFSRFLILSGGFEVGQLFAKTSPRVNGDQMRGPYLNAKLGCGTSKHLEIHAVNVDYELSSSAARLTQNS